MSRFHVKPVHLINIFFFLLFVVNCIITYLCVGITVFLIPIWIFSFSFVQLLFTNSHSNPFKNIKWKNQIAIGALILLCILTYSQSPQYTYESARSYLVQELKKEQSNVKAIDVEIPYIKATTKLNWLIDKGYYIGIKENEEISYYFFDPITGHFIKITEFY